MTNVECPLVSCLHLGDTVPGKSKILNEMGQNLNNFWHEGLEGGERIQKVSQGMVEVSWHFPGNRASDKFNTPVTFANLRGDAQKYPILTEKLTKTSTVTCIFTQTMDSVYPFLKNTFGQESSKRIVVILSYKPDEKDKVKPRLKKLNNMIRKKLKLREHACTVISYPFEENQFHKTHTKLHGSLKSYINNTPNGGKSLSSLVNELKSSMKVDDKKSYDGRIAAQSILHDIDKIKSQKPPCIIKSKILPCQSDVATREKIGKHDKETCRYRDITAKEDIEQYASRKKQEKWQLQWQQLQHPMSKTFANFLKYIINFYSLNRKYFLQSLKLGLNERSADILQPLYAAYEKCLLKVESEQTDTERKQLNEQLAQSSLGLEHFFREMAVMYENMVALRKKIGRQESLLDSILDTFTQTMADILLDGEAMEVLDGDVAHSSVPWLTAVMNRIEERKAIRVFKMSVVGAQSCGKSTLLNTLFGLNFPVSTGRCTRGAYMQLVKMDEQLAERLKCDYLLVIDSEGLMSRLSKNEDYDNELATFVIGLSDLTLVAIKGEGKEMGDVLPIAIHVFLRMNVLGELQACHFVHQNMGAVDAEKKMLTEIDAFIESLDEKTRTAAKEAGQGTYNKFKDALRYDSKSDNTYVGGLWDGTPPMGKVDIEYSYTMQKLKAKILERVKYVTKEKSCSTLADFSKWLEDIWEAFKYENFVFSFRNVLAMETYKRLSKIFNDEQWEIKKNVRTLINRMKKDIKDETLTKLEQEYFVGKTQNMKQEVEKKIVGYIQNLTSDILHYFKCSGCSKCSDEVRNRHFLRHYKAELEHDINRFKVTLSEEVNQSTDNLTAELAASITLNQLSSQMDSLIKKEVQELIEKMISQSKSLTQEQMKKRFEDLWKTVADEILKNNDRKWKEIDIKASVQTVITAQLVSDAYGYNKKKPKSPRTYKRGFDVLDLHVTKETNQRKTISTKGQERSLSKLAVTAG